MKPIEGGHVCAICGNYHPSPDTDTMERPVPMKIKRPVQPTECLAIIHTNMQRIKDLRSRGISFRAIVDRLALTMNHTTLQKHFARIVAGTHEIGKRGRRKAA